MLNLVNKVINTGDMPIVYKPKKIKTKSSEVTFDNLQAREGVIHSQEKHRQ